MAKRKCTVTDATVNGRPGVRAECSYCDHTVESLGRGEGSKKRCLALMREECPRGEENFYVDDGG